MVNLNHTEPVTANSKNKICALPAVPFSLTLFVFPFSPELLLNYYIALRAPGILWSPFPQIFINISFL